MMIQGAARSSLTLVALFALGLGSILGYTYAQRDSRVGASSLADEVAAPVVAQRASPANAQPAQGETALPQPAAGAEPTAVTPEPPSDTQLLADALGSDATKGEAIVRKLAQMPKERSLPILRRVLTSGDESRRVLALHSLRTVARDQGDNDGEIRSVVREAIYHGDNEALTSEAQSVLSDIETTVSTAR
jgi:hypothetical protein